VTGTPSNHTPAGRPLLSPGTSSAVVSASVTSSPSFLCVTYATEHVVSLTLE
jgi:hypothetical protein